MRDEKSNENKVQVNRVKSQCLDLTRHQRTHVNTSRLAGPEVGENYQRNLYYESQVALESYAEKGDYVHGEEGVPKGADAVKDREVTPEQLRVEGNDHGADPDQAEDNPEDIIGRLARGSLGEGP